MGSGIFTKSIAALSLSFALAAGMVSTAYAQMGPHMGATPSVSTTEEINAHNAIMATPHQYKHPTLASRSNDEVGVAIVLMIDISGSIDNADYDAQVQSLARAIGSDNFRDAIFLQGGVDAVAISVIDYGTSVRMRIPWVDIREGDDDKLQKLAREIFNLERRESGSTNQADALDFAAMALDNLPWDAKQKNVQIITDGEHNHGGNQDQALKDGVENVREAGASLDAFLIIDANNTGDLEEYADEKLRTTEATETDDGHIVDEGFVVVVATNKSPSNPGALVKYYQDMLRALVIRLRPETASLDPRHLEGTPYQQPKHRFA